MLESQPHAHARPGTGSDGPPYVQAQVLTDQSQQRENETRQALERATEQVKEQQQAVASLITERDALQQGHAESAKSMQLMTEKVASLEEEVTALRNKAQRRSEETAEKEALNQELLEVRRQRNKLQSGRCGW